MNSLSIAINLLNFTSAQIAGAGVFTKNLLKAWLTSPHNHRITILHSSAINVYDVFDLPHHSSIKLIRKNVNTIPIRILYEQCVLPFTLSGFDIYFSPTPSVPFFLKKVNPGIRTLITIHDMIPFFFREKYGKARSLYVRFLSKYGAKCADEIVTVSENSKNDIQDISNVDSKKITVIYNFFINPPLIKERIYENFFVSISTIEPGKNIENTIMGFRKFIDKYSARNFKFYWLGKIGWGYSKESLTELITSLNLDQHFFLLGYVDNDKKNSLLRNCAALVYLSHYEGFGLPVLEGLYYYKPAIVSKISSLPEVIGEAGVLCDKDNVEEIADAMHDIVLNSNQYQAKIPQQLKKFDKDTQVSKFLGLINKN